MDRKYTSQSMYNEAASEKAYQRQVREQAADRYDGKEWWPDEPDLSSARVRETTRDVALKIIREYEWLGTLPPSSNYHGIFLGDEGEDPWACAGVTCWVTGGGAGANSADEFGIDQSELAYLHRGACVHWAPENTNSKLISYSLDAQREKGSKVALAYADRDAGEMGTVYQATGWLCLGPGKSVELFEHPETGETYNQKVVHDMLVKNELDGVWTWSDMRDYMVDEKGWDVHRTMPKYRFAKILAEGDERRRILEEVEDTITGYPKRERDEYPDGVDVDEPDHKGD